MLALCCYLPCALAQLQINPGVSIPFTVSPGRGLVNGTSGYFVNVPADATRLEIRLATFSCDTDVSLYVRYATDVDGSSGSPLYDFIGAGPTTSNHIVVIDGASSPFPLKPGQYYIAYQSSSTDVVAHGSITVLLDSQSAPTAGTKLLSPGDAPAPFEFGCIDAPQLFNGKFGYAVIVPPGTASVKVQVSISTPGAQVDIYARNGADMATISQADFSDTTPGQSKTLNITGVPAQGATYYIDLRLPSNGGLLTGTIAASLLSANPAMIGTSAAALNFTSQAGSNPGPQSFTIQNTGGGTLKFVINKSQSWLTLSQTEGTSSGAAVTITASVNTAGLPAGNYSDDIRISDQGSPPAASALVHVTLLISSLPSASIGVSVNSLSFTTPVGSSPAPQTLSVQNTGGGTLNFAVANNQPWLIVSPGRGTSSGSPVVLTVSVNTASLSQGAYSDDIRITDAGSSPGSPASIHVTLTVTGSVTPAAVVSTATLVFNTQAGTNPPSQGFSVQNGGGGTLVYQITSSEPWLSVFPALGSSTGNPILHTASVNTAGVAAGTYTAEIRISQNSGAALSQASSTGAPQAGSAKAPEAASVIITVRLTITSPATGGAPVVSAAVNAASSLSPALPGGSIARGSIFSLYGTGLGPQTLATVSSFPIQPSLGGSSITITQGSTSFSAYPLAATATQINAIMPSNAPLGSSSVTVNFNGQASQPFTINVVNASFGIFTANQSGGGPAIIQNFNSSADQPVNSTLHSAKPGQAEILWGTGLGPITSSDALQPPIGGLPVNVQVFVGNKAASTVFYSGRSPQFAGVDQINFNIPADAPLGCYVPVSIQVNGVPSNVGTLSISADGKPCSDLNPLSGVAAKGGKIGVIALRRLALHLQAIPGQPAADLTSDTASAAFASEPGGEFGFDTALSLPPPGTCTSYGLNNATQAALLSGQMPSLVPAAHTLSAGSQLTVTGPNGSRIVAQNSGGTYFSVLGGSIPAPGQSATPPFLDPGAYSIFGVGGPDVGVFSANVTVPQPITWTNRDAASQIDRSQGVTVNWNGGSATQIVLIEGGNLDTQANAASVYVCVASAAAGSFTIPPSVLGSVPATVGQQTFGFLFMGAVSAGDVALFAASGIDAGAVLPFALNGTTSVYK